MHIAPSSHLRDDGPSLKGRTIVVTGASGRIGRQLGPLLANDGRLLLVGRDGRRLAAAYENEQACDYEELAQRDLSGATVVHLAVRNNDRPGSYQDFDAVNVAFLLQVAELARARGARRFINLCSTHALSTRDDPYSRSKRDGASKLRAMWPEGAVNLYIPAVYDGGTLGRLRRLDRLPRRLHSGLHGVLQLAKPVISVERVYAALRKAMDAPLDSDDPWSGEKYAADPLPERGFASFAKRTIDLAAALAVAVFGGWAMALIAAYIRLDSPGPAIFAQRRVGKGGREFTCYKFRTMAVGTAQVATHAVSTAAVTRAGCLLRRTKLDELPQILNIFRNEMSLVGPRPCLPSQHQLVETRMRRDVLSLKPGITGLAQVHDVDMSDPQRLAAWDDRYRTFRTVLLDLALLLRTAAGAGKGDRVVHSTEPVANI